MSFLDYASVRPWAKAIRKSVLNRSMPPFPAAGPIGKYQDDIRLTDEEIATIASWVDGGGLRGDADDAPTPLKWPAHTAQIEDPDLVIEFPSISSDPRNQDLWAVLYSGHVFEETTWIDSYELIASDPSLMHHARVHAIDNTFYIPEKLISYGPLSDLPQLGKNAAENSDANSRINYLDVWTPGTGVMRRPGGTFRVRAGERIILRAHIAPTPEIRTSNVSLALRLANGEVTTRISKTVLLHKDFEIQPGEDNYTYRGEREIRGAGWLRSVWVHMHRRGKSVRLALRYKDGETKEILRIPRWDFDWQRVYHLTTPIPVPPGTKLEAIAVWDNSERNPDNPDPKALVKFGPRTEDEMFVARTFISQDLKRPLLIEKGLLVKRDAQR